MIPDILKSMCFFDIIYATDLNVINMINIKKLIFLFLSLVAFAMPAIADDVELTPRPQEDGVDPKTDESVPYKVTETVNGVENLTKWATRIPSVTYVAGAYKELYENKVGDVVKVNAYDAETNPYNVDNGNLITSVEVTEIDNGNTNLKTRRIQYSRDNVKIPVKDDGKTYDSTKYTTIWVE